MKSKRAISLQQLFRKDIQSLDFKGPWLEAIGRPEITGSWIIWGGSGNGKTRFALQLAKYLTTFGKHVVFDSLEEGVSLSLRNAIADCNMQEVSRRFLLLDKEPLDDLIQRLDRPRSPQVVIIDSIQYTGLNYTDYKNLRDRFRSKLFILISHAEGSQPSGRVARSIRFDAFVKIWIEGYKAFPMSRYGGGEPYTIWEEGALSYTQPKSKSS